MTTAAQEEATQQEKPVPTEGAPSSGQVSAQEETASRQASPAREGQPAEHGPAQQQPEEGQPEPELRPELPVPEYTPPAPLEGMPPLSLECPTCKTPMSSLSVAGYRVYTCEHCGYQKQLLVRDLRTR